MEEGDEQPATRDSFTDHYGWIYNVKSVAEFEGITMEDAFSLNVIHGLNDLSYLKAKSAFDARNTKQ